MMREEDDVSSISPKVEWGAYEKAAEWTATGAEHALLCFGLIIPPVCW
jgi:hypothetical protein